MAPRVTVLIPTYNWSSVLPYSIGSVLRQSFGDFELLVIGDGCMDDSEAVVRGVGDPRVRWINLERNSGHQSGPNNLGLQEARGEIIAYLGHDDLWLRHHLSLLVAAVDAGADVAYGITELVSPDGQREPVPHGPGRYSEGMWLPPSGMVHRRATAMSSGGWRRFHDVSCDPETDLCRRMSRSGASFVFVPRLTAVKFPAEYRRLVYQQRPCHEQAVWFARIGAEDDFEARELALMLMAAAELPVWRLWRWAHTHVRLLGFLGSRRLVLARRRRYKGA